MNDGIGELGGVRDRKATLFFAFAAQHQLFANRKPKSEARFSDVFTLLIYDKYFRRDALNVINIGNYAVITSSVTRTVDLLDF